MFYYQEFLELGTLIMSKFSRRDFLKTAAASGAVVSLGPMAAPAFANRLNVNEEARVAVIGFHSRGKAHINGFSSIKGVRIAALCDADEAILNDGADSFEKKAGYKVDRHVDYRDVLKRDDIDIVTIATPNYWHALMTIEACQQGKHVYVEKPVCHTIWEGRKMVEAMRKYGRVVGAGFQNRSDSGLLEAFPWVKAGHLGKIKKIRGLCYRNRASIGKRDTPLAPPKSVDYDLWLGPAADLPIMRPKFHYDWHWVFNTGNGDMGNQGPHELDIIRWMLGDPKHPSRVTSVGGRFAWDDAGNTPNMQVASFDFGNDIPVVFEVRNMNSEGGKFQSGRGVGIVVSCEDGEFVGGRGGGAAYDKNKKVVKKFPGDGGDAHMANFVQAVRAGDAEQVHSKLESAYYSACMSHLANISVLTGEEMVPEAAAERVAGDEMLSEVLDRFSKQLSKLSVDFRKTPWHVGSTLEFDAVKERFVGEKAGAANQLVHREDRKPFVVPENV